MLRHEHAPAETRTDRLPLPARRRSAGPTLITALAIGGIGWAGSACAPETAHDATADAEEYASPDTEASATPSMRILNETSVVSDGNVTGTIRTVERSGRLVLEAEFLGLPPGEHAWHIHSGACGTDAPVVLALSSTSEMEGTVGPIEADADGHADRTVALPGLDRSWIGANDHSLHVHERPGTDHGPTLACANL